MLQFSAILIGSESLTIACGRQLMDAGHQISAVVTDSADVRAWAEQAGLACHGFTPDVAAKIGTSADWILSVANLRLLREDVLQLGRRGAVNFHDGPLPRYAGLNAPVWARLHGEAQHAITWHMISGGIDEGGILAQEPFAISPADTALTLNTRAFEAALDSFPRVMQALSSDSPETRSQDFSRRSYFGKHDRPDNFGFIYPQGTVKDALAIIRALDHGAYWNPLCTAKVLVQGKVLTVLRADIAHDTDSGSTGTLLGLDGDQARLTLSDGALDLTLSNPAPQGRFVAASPQIDERLRNRAQHAVRQDDVWRKVLHSMIPATFRAATGKPSGTLQSLTVDTDRPSALVAALFQLARFLHGGTCTLAHGVEADAFGLLSPWVPVNDPREIAGATARGPFMADLTMRDPVLRDNHMPALAVSDHGPVPGALITLTGNQLHYDTGAVSDASAQLFAARLAHFAAGRDMTCLPEQEQAMLARWNATDQDWDDTPVFVQIARQAQRTPNATALIVEDQSLSYAALNARANQVAHVLQAKGIGADSLVGLYTHRSLDMIVGALGIWKAGGAYVPLDPSYPASRTQGYIEDSAVRVILTQSDINGSLPETGAEALCLDSDAAISAAPINDPVSPAQPDALAYLIFTSGSTGRPKGVMVEHGNLSNFCAGMDARVSHDPAGTWMAVTSLNFDISILELFYTLARGFKVVVTSDETRAILSNGPVMKTHGGMEFSLYYWGNDDGPGARKYELLLEGAKFADANGFCAVWTPERHFHAFGGPYPNPSVTGAAVAAVTKNLGVRAGSCVAPLHHPARIAEEWAVIDNLTEGRAGIAIASGWQPDDFVLRPENTPPQNKPAMLDSIETVRKLWRGESVGFAKADGTLHEVITQPRPVSRELPVWVTTAGNPETWKEAGRLGANVLTHLLGQSIDDVESKIKLYHAALREAGYDPASRSVTLMLHTFVAESREKAEQIAREPMKDYLRAAAGLIKQYAWAFPAFKRPEGASNAFDLNLDTLEPEELEGILDFAFQRYFEDSGLFGTVQDCTARVEALKGIGVTEVACLIDYGIAPDVVLQGLKPLAEVVARANSETAVAEDDYSIAAQLVRHEVTHLQCTPSMARMIAMDDDARSAMADVGHIMVGGEALPGSLVADLKRAAPRAGVTNMYGPTETTIWSSTQIADAVHGTVNLGTPIANTTFHVLDESAEVCPIGMEGELYIGGAGVTRGYWQREDLTAERFVTRPEGRLYRTGDLVRWTEAGDLEFLGRVDHQIKLRGYRIELGEIEATLEMQSDVTQAVVIAREDVPGDVRLVAYVTGTADVQNLRGALVQSLPAHMVPSHIEHIDAMPLTPNKKVDRKALPKPGSAETRAKPALRAVPEAKVAAPSGGSADIEARIAAVWERLLGVRSIKPSDNFFDLGGHSLLAVQAHREIRDTMGGALSITDIFRYPVLKTLSAKLAESGGLAAQSETASAMEAPAQHALPQGNSRAQARTQAMSKRRAMRAARAQR